MPIAYSTVLYLIFVWLDVSLEVRGVGDGGMVIGHTILIPPGLDGWAGSAWAGRGGGGGVSGARVMDNQVRGIEGE